jgi:SAM-dependent methyltransferase
LSEAQTEQTRYVLATGDEGEGRLRIVNAVHGPDTLEFLRLAGIRPGMRVADIGCGAGLVSVELARMAGEEGEVWAVDASPEQVAVTRRRAERDGLANVRAAVGRAEATGLSRGSFDLVYCRFVLMHVPDAMAALCEMQSLLAPGGILACEDGDFTAPYCDPPDPAFDRVFELYCRLGQRRGLDFVLGRRLYGMFHRLGFTRPSVRLVQPVALTPEKKRLPGWTLEEAAPSLLEAGLATQDELDALFRRMLELAEDPGVVFAMARMTQIWSRADGN